MWFRDDLRLRDNAALTYAASHGPVVCLFVEEENTGIRPVGAAARWWRNRSILALKSELENHGAHLLIARGDPRDIVPAVAAQLHSRFLDGFSEGAGYAELNDVPAADATSGLSPHLRFGEISPAFVWAETARFADAAPHAAADAWAFLRQLLWRDFAWHRLAHLPHLATENVRNQFDRFPWAWSGKAAPGASTSIFAHPDMEPDGDARQHLAELSAWQQGRTGIPLIDAGMRELWATGTMHNRVRMVTGSWLTKNLGIHWRHGEEWFWDTLVDADYAANPFNWQWVAGSGNDAAPYFHIFNPVTQEQKFDPQGLYVARWVPERNTPLYPEPMVDVKESRKTALAAYDDIRT